MTPPGPPARDRPGVARPRLGTVRSRLTVLATTVVGAVLVVSAVALVTVQREVLVNGVDESLRQRADEIRSEAGRAAEGDTLPSEGDPEDSFLQVVSASGVVIATSANVRDVPAALPPRPAGADEVVRTVRLPAFGGDQLRVLAQPLAGTTPAPTLLVATNLDDVSESVRVLTISLVVSIPVVVLLLAALIWWLTGRTLSPVEAIRKEVASIQGGQLRRRVTAPASGDEISRLARTMNAMLERVEHATNGQRVFAADASHELRGPLTRIRADLELGIAHPGDDDPTATYRRLLDDVVQLQSLVDDLLFLARNDSGTDELPTERVDLDDVVLGEAQRMRARGQVHVDTTGLSAARTIGDGRQLERVVRNLASNAERHARTWVRFELRERGDRAEIVVADDGPGVPTEQHARIFERFTRLDEARSRDVGGSGLGLAIVDDIVSRHGGTIRVTSVPGEGARFVVSLPRAD